MIGAGAGAGAGTGVVIVVDVDDVFCIEDDDLRPLDDFDECGALSREGAE